LTAVRRVLAFRGRFSLGRHTIGPGTVPLTESDILGPSEAFRKPMDYCAHAPQTLALLESLARLEPTTLACLHGSAWRGDGAALLRALAAALEPAATAS
jgi:hypothetical protein